MKLKMYIQSTFKSEELNYHEVAIIHYDGLLDSFDVNSRDCIANVRRFEKLKTDIVHKTIQR